VLVHGSVIVLLLIGLPERKPAPLVYAVELVAAPLPTTARRLAPEAVARPTPPAPEAPAPKEEPVAKAPEVEAPVKPKATPAPATPPRPVRYWLKFASLPMRFTSVMFGVPSCLAWTRPDRRTQATARYQ
jgi:hypothetical protein